MELENLRKAVNKIELPKEMQKRIIRNCQTKMEENTMSKENTTNLLKKPMIAIATFALCLCLTSLSVMAATGKLQGYFKDITRWDGAVTGTTYEQATDEISMDVTVNGNELTALVTFANPQMAPYVYAERLGIAAYRIVDTNGKVVKEGAADSIEVVNGQTAVSIQLDDIDSGSYKLIVTAFVSEKKADQPLNISGNWECAFTK